MSDLTKVIDNLKQLLTNGDIATVQTTLDGLDLKKIKRNQVLPLANIARRVGYTRLAVSLLNAIVRPKIFPNKSDATKDEIVEYGLCLFRLGILHEARNLLSSPIAQDSLDQKLYLAFTYFGSWDYETAQTLLESYLKSEGLSIYDRLIGKTNLAQAYYVNDSPQKAVSLLNEVIDQARSNNFKLLVGNALQILSEAHLVLKDFDRAKDALSKIEAEIGQFHHRYSIYIDRNFATIALYKNHDSGPLMKVREKAKTKQLSEVCRECDLLISCFLRDADLFRRVYYGTPHSSYRVRAKKKWGSNIELGEHYMWQIPENSKAADIFDLENGSDQKSGASLKRGFNSHRLLQALTSDFYKSFKSESLFGLLYPNECYLLETSTQKVWDTISRTRIWLKENQIAMDIGVNFGSYNLTSETGIKIKLKLNEDQGLRDPQDSFLIDLEKKVVNKYFTSQDVASYLNFSVSSANRHLRRAFEKNLVEKIGVGRNTKYRIKKTA
ncbi:MAG: hypothetical protein A4S09_09840 [Proteobacteria bacterium SG_bin7]|nr:MAG: hypothetical protein A4S09_09840 [Proteobacteria bacterium SG_bin7]